MISAERVNDLVKTVEYYHFRGSTTTACCLVLTNGYSVVGTSSAGNPDEFDIVLGQKYAREDADEKVRGLLAFVDREVAHAAQQ